MKKIKLNQRITLVGSVVTRDWDESDNTLNLEFVTDDFDSLSIANNRIGRELAGHIDCEIKAQGVITGEDENGYNIFTIKSYQLLDQ